jgi:heme A synthase
MRHGMRRTGPAAAPSRSGRRTPSTWVARGCAFALEDNIDNGPVSGGDTTGVTLHHSFAYVVVLFAVALLAVSFGAKVEHGVRWAAIPLGLIVAQFFLAYAAYSAAIVGVLHGLNALAIFAVALLAGRRVPKTAPVAEPSAPEDAPV